MSTHWKRQVLTGKLIKDNLLYINHCLSKSLKYSLGTLLKLEALYHGASSAATSSPVLVLKMRMKIERQELCDDKTIAQ